MAAAGADIASFFGFAGLMCMEEEDVQGLRRGGGDQEDELVYEDDDLTWDSVVTAIGADESIYHLRRLSSRSRALDKSKGVETTSTSSTSSRTRTLIDEESEEEDDEE
ncbi:hypothetical protein H5410_055100 [Solanum commersonii]|uniref:Uncharacterized protein n=1 Tax=Solanum commersonii TaxID=4109 RepID=A0A9J5WJD8_SOLCO|nr:hypothetical protein H5410_055100 [Solanum commersonii]